MNKKIIGLALCGLISTGTLVQTLHTNTVNAAEVPSVTVSKKIDQSKFQSTIQTIENNYLKQNNDGTFYITDDVYNSVDAEVVNLIKSNMEEINSLILSDELEFKIESSSQNTKVINTKNTVDITDSKSPVKRGILDSFGTVLSSPKYAVKHTFYWWGFHAIINKAGAAIMQSDFTFYAGLYGGGSALLISYIPGGAALAKEAGFGVGSTFAVAINACSKGVASGKGVNVTVLGKPTTGQVIGVTAII